MKNFPVLLAGLVLLSLLSDCNKKTIPEKVIPNPIEVCTIGFSNLATTSVNVSGTILGGPVDIIARGVCWATHPYVSVADNKTSDGTGMGSFTSSITGLSPFTYYYIRAYAESTNDPNAESTKGIYYGDEIKIRTAMAIPVVTTNMMTTAFPYDASAVGTVTDAGGSASFYSGFCWSTAPNPTINDNLYGPKLQTIYNFPFNFVGPVSRLSPNTTYYLKAFATNSAGTGYGNQVTFTTNSEAIPAQDYLPLQVGNYWEFSNGYYGGSILIDKIVNLNGVDYFRSVQKQNPDLFASVDTLYLRKTSNGIVYQLHKNSTHGETVLFYLAGGTGEVWNMFNTTSITDSYGKLSSKSDSVIRNSVVFTDCYRFEYYYHSLDNGNWDWDYWLAPNVGFVKFWPISPHGANAERLTKSIINGVVQTY